ncbi:hypothetical protein T5p083 [Escherichia phage T5]|uniref:Transmembrane protein n=1 Tax=Escherichia phage T5 TaxID=2695836 RepID=Q66LY0_BPT5|nr:hypothetical protein T5p083 [Escherichia phage T5]
MSDVINIISNRLYFIVWSAVLFNLVFQPLLRGKMLGLSSTDLLAFKLLLYFNEGRGIRLGQNKVNICCKVLVFLVMLFNQLLQSQRINQEWSILEFQQVELHFNFIFGSFLIAGSHAILQTLIFSIKLCFLRIKLNRSGMELLTHISQQLSFKLHRTLSFNCFCNSHFTRTDLNDRFCVALNQSSFDTITLGHHIQQRLEISLNTSRQGIYFDCGANYNLVFILTFTNSDQKLLFSSFTDFSFQRFDGCQSTSFRNTSGHCFFLI